MMPLKHNGILHLLKNKNMDKKVEVTKTTEVENKKNLRIGEAAKNISFLGAGATGGALYAAGIVPAAQAGITGAVNAVSSSSAVNNFLRTLSNNFSNLSTGVSAAISNLPATIHSIPTALGTALASIPAGIATIPALMAANPLVLGGIAGAGIAGILLVIKRRVDRMQATKA